MQNLAPDAFKALIASPGTVVLDVRTPEEIEIAALPGAINIPLGELGQRVDELNRSAPIAVLCHHGVRSEMAGRILERNGFAAVAHLIGGIDAWSQVIDPTIPRY